MAPATTLPARPAVRLAHFAALFVLHRRYDRGVDRPEVADERAPGDAQPDLRLLPRLVGFLALKDLAHGVADWDQFADDPRMLGKDAVCIPALLHRNDDGCAVDHLHQGCVLADEITAFADADADSGCDNRLRLVTIEAGRLRSAIVDGIRKMEDGGGKYVFKHDGRARHASVRLTVGARPERMLTEHHLGMLGEMAVHPDSALVLGRGMDFGEIEPGVGAGSIAIAPLPEEEDVDANVGAGVGTETSLGKPDRADKIGAAGDVLTRGRVRFVHRAMRGHESGETSGLQPVDRLDDEIIVQPKAEGPERPVAAHRAIGKWRIADREIKVLGEFGSCEVLVDDVGARMQQGCDARGDRIELDAGEIARRA